MEELELALQAAQCSSGVWRVWRWQAGAGSVAATAEIGRRMRGSDGWMFHVHTPLAVR